MFKSFHDARRWVAVYIAAIERGEDVEENQQALKEAQEWIQAALEDGTIEVLETGRIQ